MKGEIWVNSNEHPDTILREGDFILQPVGSTVEFRMHTPVEAITLMINGIRNVCDIRYQSGLNYVEDATLKPTVLKACQPMTIFLGSLKMALNDDMCCEGFLNVKLTELHYIMICYYPLKDLGDFFIPIYRQGRSFHFFVMNNYQQAKDVESFAKLGGYSVSSFRRLFKETFEEPVYQWMLKQKCQEVLKDVTTTDMSITEISAKYGFESLANFSHFCRTNFGKSPRALRAK
ncbi:transcriptional regulator [Alphaproteobacteria bacterium]|nr:transcriptional regulator [Alphaproteobacteria bacterium]